MKRLLMKNLPFQPKKFSFGLVFLATLSLTFVLWVLRGFRAIDYPGFVLAFLLLVSVLVGCLSYWQMRAR